jgi:hypothetical protein
MVRQSISVTTESVKHTGLDTHYASATKENDEVPTHRTHLDGRCTGLGYRTHPGRRERGSRPDVRHGHRDHCTPTSPRQPRHGQQGRHWPHGSMLGHLRPAHHENPLAQWQPAHRSTECPATNDRSRRTEVLSAPPGDTSTSCSEDRFRNAAGYPQPGRPQDRRRRRGSQTSRSMARLMSILEDRTAA